MTPDIRPEPTGSWSYHRDGYMYALSGTFCHLMHVIRKKNGL